MKDRIPKVSWTTKMLSNTPYIREVSIDGKKANLFHRRLGYYDLYVAQVMRLGNCLTLLSSVPSFSLDNFRNTNLLVDMVRFVYWTFNEAFLIRLEEYLCSFSINELSGIHHLLEAYPKPFICISDNEMDEELIWCSAKNQSLQKDIKFNALFEKDNYNRQACIKHIRRLINSKTKTNLDLIGEDALVVEISFADMLLTEDKALILSEMEQEIISIGFPRNPFHPVAKNKKGANQYGLNAQMAAIVFHYQQQGYFKSEFTFKEIYKAFGKMGGNESGKDYNLDYFKQDFLFDKYLHLFSSE